MVVSELIEKLKLMPQDASVTYWTNELSKERDYEYDVVLNTISDVASISDGTVVVID
jgi:hypothetical protein